MNVFLKVLTHDLDVHVLVCRLMEQLFVNTLQSARAVGCALSADDHDTLHLLSIVPVN